MSPISYGRVAWALFCRAGWAPLTVFLLHVGPWLSWFYARFRHFDVPMHVLGGVVIASFVSAAFAALPDGAIAPRFRGALEAAVVFGVTCVAAVFWEFLEFLADRYLGTRVQIGLPDTLLDLLMGALGGAATIGALFARGLLGRVRPIEA